MAGLIHDLLQHAVEREITGDVEGCMVQSEKFPILTLESAMHARNQIKDEAEKENTGNENDQIHYEPSPPRVEERRQVVPCGLDENEQNDEGQEEGPLKSSEDHLQCSLAAKPGSADWSLLHCIGDILQAEGVNPLSMPTLYRQLACTEVSATFFSCRFPEWHREETSRAGRSREGPAQRLSGQLPEGRLGIRASRHRSSSHRQRFEVAYPTGLRFRFASRLEAGVLLCRSSLSIGASGYRSSMGASGHRGILNERS